MKTTSKQLKGLVTSLSSKGKVIEKNSTPRQIAILISAYAALVNTVVLTVLFFLNPKWPYWGFQVILAGAITFAAAYFTSLFFITNYIFRKVKVIYKAIRNYKVSPEEKQRELDPDRDFISEVEQEVSDWAKRQQEELERHQAWADYRKRFLGDISHELKTPIFNIQGYLHTLLDNNLEDTEVNIPFLTKAVKNAERLQTIVEDLESISKLEQGSQILDIQSFELKSLVEEVFDDLRFKALEKNIRLEFKEGAVANFKVSADKESIRQVLTNLVHNSIKYGNPNGRTKVGFYDMDKYLLVEVADNGIGIAKKHLPHVFDRFYRADKSRSREHGGSGLGLSIVKHIVDAHGQTINVRSTPDVGSTFGFTLEKA